MSADNYMHILKRDDGKYVVQNRSASAYYADEGWSEDNAPSEASSFTGSADGWSNGCDGKWYETYEDAERAAPRRPDWIEPAPSGGREFATLTDAEDYAYSEYSEYGVSYGFPVKRYTVEVEDDAA